MTAGSIKISAGASSAAAKWRAIDWRKIEANVHRLQMRIAKAERDKRHGKVQSLQWLLTHSFEAKLLAVKRVTSSKGAKTAGVDGKLYLADSKKMQLARALKQHSYRVQPLRRVYIPKRDGTKRPLGIPTMYDRAMQALYLLALEPIAEMRADPNSYGFRPYRSTADAVEKCFKVLNGKKSVQWILEGDIKACFDTISHDWLLENIPLEKRILAQWLKAGYVENQALHPTPEGTPQGGVISPVLANMALDGLEEAVTQAAKRHSKSKVHTARYADDFVVMGISKELLEKHIKPAIVKFLKERGLVLSEEKTLITHVDKGFDFLGYNVRKYDGKLLIKPSKKSIKTSLGNIRNVININKMSTTHELIGKLNPKIRGWVYYFRHVVAKRTFEYIDDCIYRKLSCWTRRRHTNKNFNWIRKKYFRRRGFNNWIFFGEATKSNGEKEIIDLIKARETAIIRYVKIRTEATPYDPAYAEYFANRKQNKAEKLYHYHFVSTLDLFSQRVWEQSARFYSCKKA